MIKKVEWENIHILMVIITMDSGKITCAVAEASRFIMMEQSSKEYGRMTKSTDKV